MDKNLQLQILRNLDDEDLVELCYSSKEIHNICIKDKKLYERYTTALYDQYIETTNRQRQFEDKPN